MKSITIIGNSIVAVSAIKTIRAQDQESEITLFCEDAQLPYQQFLFGEYLAKVVPEEKILCESAGFYKEQRVKTFTGRKIGRIDFKKNKIVTEEKEQLLFDILLLTRTANGANRFGEIKGANKMGVFGCQRLGDMKDILAILHLLDTVIINVDNVNALKLACGFKLRKKDVIIVVSGPHILSTLIDGQPAKALEKLLADKGIRVITENAVAEVLGDGEVKAVRLKSGKVLAGQAVVLPEIKTDLKLFADSPLKLNKKILVNGQLRTNLENVFAVDQLCEFADSDNNALVDPNSLLEQGRVVGANILGQNISYSRPPIDISFEMLGISFALKGCTKLKEGLQEEVDPAPSESSYRATLREGEVPVGAVLIEQTEEVKAI